MSDSFLREKNAPHGPRCENPLQLSSESVWPSEYAGNGADFPKAQTLNNTEH